MDSNANEQLKIEIQEDACSPASTKDQNQITLRNEPTKTKTNHENKFLNFVRSNLPSKSKLRKFGPSPSVKFRQIALQRDEMSRSVRSDYPISPPNNHSRLHFVRKIDWAQLWIMSVQWFRDPLNIALFIWIFCVAVSGAILFLVMTGMLNRALPKKSQRDTWFEVNNQILNALFTLMCLYQHPKRIYHFVLLLRWKHNDILRLRKVYCKNGTYKPHEWSHIMAVVLLLNLNCFAQYALCGLNLGYPRSRRPPIGVALCISVAIAAPAFAGLYNIMSPLGRDYDIEIDEEAQIEAIASDTSTKPATVRLKSLEKRYSFMRSEERRFAEPRPEWVGGIFDFWDDISLAYLSIFCSCCVFGWNMQRLGFGNMYVHIVTFVLFCSAPFFIFNLAAVNINNEVLRETLGLTGIVLCFLGLLYGGFWRIQMRKRFNLPGNKTLCLNPSATDCLNWLCCCWCSLAQEVRTADYYEILAESSKTFTEQMVLSPLPREDGVPLFTSGPSSPYVGKSSPSIFKLDSPVNVRSPLRGGDKVMRAPVPSVIERDED